MHEKLPTPPAFQLLGWEAHKRRSNRGLLPSLEGLRPQQPLIRSPRGLSTPRLHRVTKRTANRRHQPNRNSLSLSPWKRRLRKQPGLHPPPLRNSFVTRDWCVELLMPWGALGWCGGCQLTHAHMRGNARVYRRSTGCWAPWDRGELSGGS